MRIDAEFALRAVNGFGGVDISLTTVERDWPFARAWLQTEISRAPGDHHGSAR
ncbi:MAG: hypothetical protein LAO79_25185 [Acidobacteriia bacterium]|nr:hypothetical protein [Terriglobia bacterium]